MEKLAHYSLLGSYTWILKLLQSIDLWRPEQLTVSQSREKTAFLFRPTRFCPTEQEVVEALQSGSWRKDDPLAQLCLALRALVEQAGLSFVLSINGEQLSTSPIYSGEDVAKLPAYERLQWAHHTKPGVQLVVSHFKGKESLTGRLIPTFSQWERRDLKIASSLENNALFYSVPVWLDGRYLNSPETHGEYGISTKHRTVALWGAPLPDLPVRPLSLPESFEGKLFSVTTTPSRALRSYSQRRDFDCWFLVKAKAPNRLRPSALYFSKAKHEILWLQNGVVVERAVATGLSTITEATILVSAEGFGTDLSGLALTRSEDRSALQEQVLGRVATEIERLARNPDFLEADDTDTSSQHEEKPPLLPGSIKDDIMPSLGFGVLGGMSLAGLPFLTSAGLIAAGTALTSYAVRKHRSSASVQAALREQWVQTVRRDLEALASLDKLSFKVISGEGAGKQAKAVFQPKNHAKGLPDDS